MRQAAKGRVVMLVDNDVERDSRVQKQARSMAEAGWDVTLLGRAGRGGARRWTIGEAKVRLLPVQTLHSRRPGDLRRARLRSPLAYSAGWVADQREQNVKARRVDLQQRRIIAADPRDGDPRRRAEGVRIFPARVSTALLGRWVDLRAAKTRKLIKSRQLGDSAVDRLTTSFWLKTMGDRAWRRLEPNQWDFEIAYGAEIDRRKPDLIHANDFRMLGVAARAVVRARAQGREVKLVWDAHEFLPGIKPWEPHPRWHLGQIAHEREYAPMADKVVTVSAELAELLQEHHGLPELPTVVLNTPYATVAHEGAHQPTIREALGVGRDVPIMVYSGAAAYQRGLDVMVEALPQLPDVVCAFVVAKQESDYVRSLVAKARELGVEDRVRLLPYVPFDQVVPFLSTADVGVIPIHHWPNHEIALITKFFEYSHARLPLVVSDVRAMGHMTRNTGQGEVFEAENLDFFVAAVRKVLDKPERYRQVYDDPALLEQWTWEAQAKILDEVYTSLLTNPVKEGS